jgi:hypothetical protein
MLWGGNQSCLFHLAIRFSPAPSLGSFPSLMLKSFWTWLIPEAHAWFHPLPTVPRFSRLWLVEDQRVRKVRHPQGKMLDEESIPGVVCQDTSPAPALDFVSYERNIWGQQLAGDPHAVSFCLIKRALSWEHGRLDRENQQSQQHRPLTPPEGLLLLAPCALSCVFPLMHPGESSGSHLTSADPTTNQPHQGSPPTMKVLIRKTFLGFTRMTFLNLLSSWWQGGRRFLQMLLPTKESYNMPSSSSSHSYQSLAPSGSEPWKTWKDLNAGANFVSSRKGPRVLNT